ncbi:hypothetical protein GCM10011581_14940 [Saccharopolyspora subtropica]|uniref:Sporulation protein YtfJ n=1 Tax=Saccharopolyspora thermophila TaxID=89367 RepID=A0A917JRI3_9PSEU|nr:hypothetical protein [Saccharopolyspora subtropica]GGI78820.1 hypothetical protein GCM10011581_14940 [Saccharopolyspora subtropica]
MTEKSDHADILDRLAEQVREHQVFGEPVRQGDTTLLPVASIRVGGGRRGRDDGRGVGVVSRPVGAFSVSADGKVAWHPAVSVNRIVWGGQLAVAVIAVAVALAFRRRR